MRLVEGFHLRSVVGETIAVPTGKVASLLSGLASMNETGEFLFSLLLTDRTEEELVEKLTEEYDIDTLTAYADVKEFINSLREYNLLIEEDKT